MEKAIVNRVANSALVTFDLEEWYPEGTRIVLDIKNWLYQGYIVREKEFRATLADHDWSQYSHCYVALTCSAEAIIPAWVYMLITTYLVPFSKKTVVGGLELLEISLFESILSAMDISYLKDKSVIVKGCTDKPIPEQAYVLLVQKLQPIVKSIMYGEACSAVPLFKKSNFPLG